jgi:cytochrome c oxidase subunit IV
MSEAHPVPTELAHERELEAESHAPYLKVWAILAILTLIEYFYAMIFKDYFLLLVLGLVGLALVKAGMVGWYFMHLKFEKKWVYLLIIPACVMAVFLTLMLYPDMAMKPVDQEEGGEESAWITPASEHFGAMQIRLASAYVNHPSCFCVFRERSSSE